MKLLSYNIFVGGSELPPLNVNFIKNDVKNRVSLLQEIIKEIDPDVLAIQKAN